MTGAASSVHAVCRVPPLRKKRQKMSSVMQWLTPGLLASVSLASTETLGVQLTKHYAPGNDAQQEVTSNHMSIATGMVSLAQLLRKHGLAGLNFRKSGCVPWYLVLALSVWRAQWLIWIDRTLQYAPNPGFGKAVINLNTVWATLIGTMWPAMHRVTSLLPDL